MSSNPPSAPAPVEDDSFQARQWDCIQRIRAVRAQNSAEQGKISSEEERALVGELVPLIIGLIRDEVNDVWALLDAAGLTSEDAENEALLKVIPTVIRYYEPERSRVSTYVSFLTHQHLQSLFQNKVIRVTAGFAKKVWKARELYNKNYGAYPTDDELIEAGFFSPDDRHFLVALRETKSGSTPFGNNSVNESNETHYSDEREPEPERALAVADEVQHIVCIINELGDIHPLASKIAKMRLGIAEDGSVQAGTVTSFPEIAIQVGMNENKVRYIFQKCMRRIQGLDVPEPVPQDPEHSSITPSQLPSVASAQRTSIEPAAPKAPLHSREKLLTAIYQALSQQLPEQYRSVFHSLIANPGRPLLHSELLPAGNSGTGWQRFTKVTTAVKEINVLLQQHDFECGVVLQHKPLQQEAGFTFINRSCVPFDIARDLTFFQWQLLNIYARNEGRVVTDEEVAHSIWQSFDPRLHHKRIQNSLGKIRNRNKENGFHIAYMDRKGSKTGHSCALESNIPSTLRLSLSQSVLLSALLFRYQNPHPTNGEWVPANELKEKLQRALSSVSLGNIQMHRQEVHIILRQVQKYHLEGIGSIEELREDNKHKTISAFRLTSWFQSKKDMLPEPTAYVRTEPREPSDGEIPLEILYMLSLKLGCAPQAEERMQQAIEVGADDLSSLRVPGVPPFVDTLFSQAVREHQFAGGLSMSQRKLLAQMWSAYGAYVTAFTLETGTGLTGEKLQQEIDVLNAEFFKSSSEQIRFHQGNGWVLSKLV